MLYLTLLFLALFTAATMGQLLQETPDIHLQHPFGLIGEAASAQYPEIYAEKGEIEVPSVQLRFTFGPDARFWT